MQTEWNFLPALCQYILKKAASILLSYHNTTDEHIYSAIFTGVKLIQLKNSWTLWKKEPAMEKKKMISC